MSKVILEKQNELPAGWCMTTLEDISLKLKAGRIPSTKISKYYTNGSVPFVKIDDITDNSKYLDKTKITITNDGLENSSAWLVPENSILYSMYASYGIPIINKISVATSQAIIVFVPPKDLLNLDYVFYYLQSIKSKLIPKGTTQGNLNAEIIRNLPIKLAPLNEQQRIVIKIDELFSLLDFSQRLFEKTKILLNQQRKSILNSAFFGNLTENWQLKQKNIQPISSAFLVNNRRKKWENAQIKKFELVGAFPKNDKWKHRYREPLVPMISSPILPELRLLSFLKRIQVEKKSKKITKNSSL